MTEMTQFAAFAYLRAGMGKRPARIVILVIPSSLHDLSLMPLTLTPCIP